MFSFSVVFDLPITSVSRQVTPETDSVPKFEPTVAAAPSPHDSRTRRGHRVYRKLGHYPETSLSGIRHFLRMTVRSVPSAFGPQCSSQPGPMVPSLSRTFPVRSPMDGRRT